jgi:hypothetical protein
MQKKIAILRGLLLIALLFGGMSIAFGQSPLATVRGEVRDPSGAPIPNANVTVTDKGKGTTRSQKTNADVQYEITKLDPGVYTIEVGSEGFQGYVNRGVTLVAGQVLRLDVPMVVGAVTERISVEGRLR